MQKSFEIHDEIAKKARKSEQNLLPKKMRDVYDKELDKLLSSMVENCVEHETVLLGHFKNCFVIGISLDTKLCW